MTAPSVLLVNNHSSRDGNPGHIDALEKLVIGGELAELRVVHAGSRLDESSEERSRRVCDGIASSSSDVVLVLSMKNLVQDMDAAGVALAGRPVIYWEGDPWGTGKKVLPEMAAWLELADYVFSVGGAPQVQLLQASGASTVHHTIHTYDHVLFSGSERGGWFRPDAEVAFIGSNLSRLPLVSGLPGSMGRWRLVGSLKRRYRERFLVAGRGWPQGVSVGHVEFGKQDQFIQRARLLANWDHYADIEAYTSDRMAIAMIAGRAQVTTLHPKMAWLPGADHGLILEPTVGGVIRRTVELLQGSGEQLIEFGCAAHAWAHHRVSHREAMRHMLSTVFPEIERPPADPWDNLPGPWVKSATGG